MIPVDEKTVPTVLTAKTNAFGLTPFLGFNFTYQKLGFGLLSGLDVLTGQARKQWVYGKSPWLGFSIGTSLTAINNK